MKNKKYIYTIILLTFIFLFLIFISPFTYSKYTQRISRELTLNAVQPTYQVVFNENGGTGSMSSQDFTYGISQSLRTNTFTREGYTFSEWNTKSDGSGTKYTDGQSVNNLTGLNGAVINLYAQWVVGGKVARINDTYYDSLQLAIDDVTEDGTETTIYLLCDTTESIIINNNQNIIFDFGSYTLKNTSKESVIKNYGTITISNGIITNTSAATSALIDNYGTGIINITGGRMDALGTKQAIYNEGGTVNISGSVIITSKAKGTYDKVERATVQNRLNGSIYITGGTIINTEASAVSLNTGVVVIGTKDNDPDSSSLMIKGKTYGVYNYTAFKYYDGTLAGKTAALYNNSSISDIEKGYYTKIENKLLDGATYNVATLEDAYTVKFNANGGTTSVSEKYIEPGTVVGELPIPIWTDYIFDGWFTDKNDGAEVTASTIINDNVEYFAHWHQEEIAEINGTKYYSLASAIKVVPSNGTETTITLLANTKENVTIPSNKNIILDLNNYSLMNLKVSPVITNRGIIKIMNGTISQTSSYAAINNEQNGELVVEDGTIVSTGERAAIYNINNGIVSIMGNSYISSNTSGQYNNGVINITRGTIMNVDDTTTTNISGGTIIGTVSCAITNNGTLNIGIGNDGIIDNFILIIIGETYGIKNDNLFNFYDGIIKGKTAAMNGEITERELNSILVNGVDGSYKTIYLENE